MVSSLGPRGVPGVASWPVECKTLTDLFATMGRAKVANRSNGVPYCYRSDCFELRSTNLAYLECEHRCVKSGNTGSHGGRCGRKLSGDRRERTRPGKGFSYCVEETCNGRTEIMAIETFTDYYIPGKRSSSAPRAADLPVVCRLRRTCNMAKRACLSARNAYIGLKFARYGVARRH